MHQLTIIFATIIAFTTSSSIVWRNEDEARSEVLDTKDIEVTFECVCRLLKLECTPLQQRGVINTLIAERLNFNPRFDNFILLFFYIFINIILY